MRFFLDCCQFKIRDLDFSLVPTQPHPNQMYWKSKKINPQESKINLQMAMKCLVSPIIRLVMVSLSHLNVPINVPKPILNKFISDLLLASQEFRIVCSIANRNCGSLHFQ